MLRLAVPFLSLAVASVAGAQAPEPTAAPARATSPAATWSARTPGLQSFRALPENAELAAGDLLVALPGASLVSKNGAVALTSIADFEGRSPLPILETALTLNIAKDVDLDFTLDRGRVDLTNKKADGPAVVRVRFWEQEWKITLDAPGTRVALELCARWPSGTRFRPADKTEKPRPPVASLLVLVLSGSASADVGGATLGLRAPPGPALVEWDSVEGARLQAQKLERLPDWADPSAGLSPEGQKRAAMVEKFRAARAKDPSRAIDAFLASADPAEQRVALVFLGATDDLPRLNRELAGGPGAAEWEFGVTVARHWLGRCAGQDQKLYEWLTAGRDYSAAQAVTVVQLLLGFSPEELEQPETYEVLIEYLRHDKPAIRDLAVWHLLRLAPRGRAIPYKPNCTAEEAAEAYRAWKELIPTGKLPPPPEKKE